MINLFLMIQELDKRQGNWIILFCYPFHFFNYHNLFIIETLFFISKIIRK